MGRKEKKPNEHYRFESKSKLKQDKGGHWKHVFLNNNGNEQPDFTTQIMYTMLISPPFKDLTARQRMLYVYAKSQFFAAVSRPSIDFRDEEGKPLEIFQKYQGKECFYLNHKLMSEVFGLYPETNHRDLYFDIEALVQRGFIERVTGYGRNKITETNHMRNIYKYSEKWKEITEADLEKIRDKETEIKKNRIKGK